MSKATDDQKYISDILSGGMQQERSIKKLYEAHFRLVHLGRKKYRELEDDDLLTAYNSTIISFRKQVLKQTFRGDSSISTYLHRIFFNKCIDILRKMSSNRETSGYEDLPEQAEASKEERSVFYRLHQQEQFTQVLALMDQLGEVCKQIILFAEYWGYNATEIAEKVGYSNARSVTSKKYDCLQRLRTMLATAKN